MRAVSRLPWILRGRRHPERRLVAIASIMKIQRLASIISILLAFWVASPAQAADLPADNASGFYGGVSLRDAAAEGPGLTFGNTGATWSRFVTPLADDTSPRALVFGGYRWRSDIAVEAAFSSVDQYALRPAEGSGGRRGVGLTFRNTAGFGDIQTRGWNLDVFTSWSFYKSFALYGRMGYAQSESTPGFVASSPVSPDLRRLRDGVNYGLGVRYDMNSALGLRLEYGRFGRFAGEFGGGLPDTDQVSVGVQLRF
jgi:hypothetical protein